MGIFSGSTFSIRDNHAAFISGLIGLNVGIQICTIWVFGGFLPFQDYYDWLYQSKILFEIWQGNALAGHHFSAALAFDTPPNFIVTVFLAVLQYVAGVSIAGNVLLSLIILLFIIGGYRSISAVSANNPFRFLPLMLAFHYFFYMGFLSFCLGLAILLNLLPFLLKKDVRKSRVFLYILCSSLLLYATHGFIFGVFMFIAVVWLFSRFSPVSSLTHKFALSLSLTPALALLIAYIASSSSEMEAFAFLYRSPVEWLQIIRHGTSFFPRITSVHSWLPLSLLNAGITLFIIVLFVLKRTSIKWSGFFPLLFASFLGMMILNPFYRIGFFEPVSSRLSLFVLLLFASIYSFKNKDRKSELIILLVALAVNTSHLLHIAGFNKAHQQLTENISLTNPESTLVIGKTYPRDFEKAPLSVFSGIVQPYIFFNSWLHLNSPEYPHYFQETGLVKPNSGESGLRGHLQGLFIDVPNLDSAVNNIHPDLERYSATFSTVIILGNPGSAELIARAFYPAFHIAETQPVFTVLERTNNPK